MVIIWTQPEKWGKTNYLFFQLCSQEFRKPLISAAVCGRHCWSPAHLLLHSPSQYLLRAFFCKIATLYLMAFSQPVSVPSQKCQRANAIKSITLSVTDGSWRINAPAPSSLERDKVCSRLFSHLGACRQGSLDKIQDVHLNLNFS